MVGPTKFKFCGWIEKLPWSFFYLFQHISIKSHIRGFMQVEEENAIMDELSEWQDEESELMQRRVEASGKGEGLVSIIKKADALRLRTLQKVVELLTPKQAVEFLIAAAELQFGVRGWGMNEDRQRGNHPDT